MLQARDEMKQGDEATKAGKYHVATCHYSEVLRMEEDNMEASMKRAQVYCLQGKHELALSDVNRALKKDSKNIEV